MVEQRHWHSLAGSITLQVGCLAQAVLTAQPEARLATGTGTASGKTASAA